MTWFPGPGWLKSKGTLNPRPKQCPRAGWFNIVARYQFITLNSKMKRLLLTTVFADLTGCLTTGIMLFFSDDLSMLPFVLIMTFGNILIPTIFAVLIYQIVKQVYYINSCRTLILHSGTMILISIVVIIIWTIVDVIYSFGIKELTFIRIKDDFKTQFLGFIPAIISVALTIPLIENFLTKKLSAAKTDNLSSK